MDERPTANDSYYVRRHSDPIGPYSFSDLAIMAKDRTLRGSDTVILPDGRQMFASHVPGLFSNKSWLVAILLSIFFGVFALDRFYLGNIWLAIGKLLFGWATFGIWHIADIVLIALRRAHDGRGKLLD
ncbi:TM2 domain [Dermatophilus congolensis]|uniref:TM2 domain n=1 Tax=Dermatophilus congolensis TaxID=1863 RepID=A0AA46H112_9MICO|nr:TM2 domain-containing protein [Dermatophilus congolensis]STD12460.1 TM2 domain [Dermatophilus congolensis]